MPKTSMTIITPGSAVHAAKRAADIVFVLQNKNNTNDKALVTQLNNTLAAYGEQTSQVTTADLDSLKVIASKLYEIFETSDTERTVALLNSLLDQYAHAPRLSNHNSSSWHLHVDSSDHAPWTGWLITSSALALAILVGEKQRNPGGLCASAACKRPFIDLGKGGGRLYCSQRCSTRERVAAYRKRTANVKS